MAGYEHPSDKDIAACDLFIALRACLAVLIAEARERGENDGAYEFPAMPAVEVGQAAVAAARVAFGWPEKGDADTATPPRKPDFILHMNGTLTAEQSQRFIEQWKAAMEKTQPSCVLISGNVDIYHLEHGRYERVTMLRLPDPPKRGWLDGIRWRRGR